ncbi:HAD family hydrolase [Saccharothrix australiensis]|uniref:Beta-phosphoglucomutase n=1 Tax=Saccharothrix australiensis TaxID=2072 RepID=A0A495VXS8_9PSEU|nr:beta-phosphoglucomutase family hydrolase [Saccharothrix australiensis]RKT54059.1 HAD superfamily hydrolase (TIGR01509 family)/beta-phosphoglucomutase family hydrolase [Saccharothrix australiensis]
MRLGLPDGITACLFDLDGVLTSTAVLHRRAWRRTFDDYLGPRGLPPFTESDYLAYVDGRPRYDGVRAFLASRGVTVPEGAPDDPPDADTVHGIGNRKNALIDAIIRDEGVTPYPGTVRYLDAARGRFRIGVVTSSANATRVLDAAGLSSYVQALVDGVVISRERLLGKPAPDSFVAGARMLGVEPAHAAVFEDALAGVRAGRAGGFGYVVGVDRVGQAEALRENGADVVVEDLAELL